MEVFMLVDKQIFIYDFVRAVSETFDLILPSLNNHHKKVAYISENIAKEMGISGDEIQDIIFASMLHDIGAFATKEHMDIMSFDGDRKDLNRHSNIGYELLKGFEPLEKAATLIKHHHIDYSESNRNVPIGSYIIHLADRTSVLFDERRETCEQIPEISTRMKTRRKDFHPEVYDTLQKLTKSELFCVEATALVNSADMQSNISPSGRIISMRMLRDFAETIAQLVDFRSKFTATHSSGVAAVAKELSILLGLPDRECKMVEIAGFLHDLGKLSVPNEVIEKMDELSPLEVNVIRKHPYYTLTVLKKIRGLERIAEWSAHHHERPDGKGYPFNIKGEQFSRQARIISVADITTALTEDRPYRPGMDKRKARSVLDGLMRSCGVDKEIADLASKHHSLINCVRESVQHEAQDKYNAFRQAAFSN
jgi:HD-GYP domain-containing protein (c-di-GMP phosphodiesterase class II)